MARDMARNRTTTTTVVEPAATHAATVPAATGLLFPFVPGFGVVISFVSGAVARFIPDTTFVRVVAVVRAVAAIVADDAKPETFAARVAAGRAAWDATGVPGAWDKIPAQRSVTGAVTMDEQNRIAVACCVAGVPVTERMISATWRAMVPVTRCDFATRAYGLTSFADMAASWRQRSACVPGIPADTARTIIAATYTHHTRRGAIDGAAITVGTFPAE